MVGLYIYWEGRRWYAHNGVRKKQKFGRFIGGLQEGTPGAILKNSSRTQVLMVDQTLYSPA